MLIPFLINHEMLGRANIEVCSEKEFDKNYCPLFIPKKFSITKNNIFHYHHLGENIYKGNSIHNIEINNNFNINLIPNTSYSLKLLLKTNNYYIDKNQWKIYITLNYRKNNHLLLKSDYYKIPIYTDNNDNSYGWFLIKWFFTTESDLDINDNIYINICSEGIDLCPFNNTKIIYSISNLDITLLEYESNLIPHPNLRIGWDEFSSYKWNNIIDWNCSNIPYPKNIDNKLYDNPIIKFKMSESYENNKENSLFQTYWCCYKNNIPLRKNTEYKFSIYIKNTPCGSIHDQNKMLYENETEWKIKSIFAIIFIGKQRGKLKSDKIEIKPSISGSLDPEITVTNNINEPIFNNGWVKCEWIFQYPSDSLNESINLYLFTYGKRQNIIYLYNPFLKKNDDIEINDFKINKINYYERPQDNKIVIVVNQSNNSINIQLDYIIKYEFKINNDIIFIDNLSEITDCINNGYHEFIIFYFDFEKWNNFTDNQIWEINNKKILLQDIINIGKINNNLSMFIINDFCTLENIDLGYTYNNKTISIKDEFTNDIESNIYLLYMNKSNELIGKDYSMTLNLFDILKIHNYTITMFNIIDEFKKDYIMFTYNKEVSKYDMFCCNKQCKKII